ncbi:class I poly(R)-hydroxyalkanoic acid synthase [Cupriavidus campinensis]
MATGKGAAASSAEDKSQPFQFAPGPFDPAAWLEWSRQWAPEINGKLPPGFPSGMPNGVPGAFPGFPGGDAFAKVFQGAFQGPAGAGLKIPPTLLAQIQERYLKDFSELWREMGAAAVPNGAAGGNSNGDAEAASQRLSDRRFASAAWRNNAPYRYAAAFYLLTARTMTELADAVEADAKTRQRIRFAVSQWVDAMSPANFLATNPDAQQRLIESGGESLRTGMRNMLGDLTRGKISQTDDTAFEVGRNVAVTEGAVVYENEYFQLLQYKPLTDKVHARPLLLVPPCINKFYILDLQPESSLVRYVVEQGHTVFLVSWRNPDASMAERTWDDYIEHAAIRAIEVARDISGQDKINVLGFCVGGTIVATALAVLAARGERPVASLTLLTALLDFTDTGILDVFVDEPHVQLREATIGGAAGAPCALLRGVELANTFSFLRPNDLVWNYVVDNYLKGNTPVPFDLLFWNGDATNLPGPWYCWYLRHMYLQDELKVPGKLSVCNAPLDLGDIDVPTYIYGSREDHIVPWTSAFASTGLLKNKLRFVLGASGHIAGVINPPAKKKRSHWINEALPGSAQEWLAGAEEKPGSWWPDWMAWLGKQAGAKRAAPADYGNAHYRAIEPAPGRYVKQRA